MSLEKNENQLDGQLLLAKLCEKQGDLVGQCAALCLAHKLSNGNVAIWVCTFA